MDGADIDWSSSSGQIKDNSGNANDGTTNGGMTNSQSAAQGRVGQALNFDGSDDYIDLQTPVFSTTDDTQPYTGTAWVKTNQSRNGFITQYTGGADDRFIFGLNPSNSASRAGQLEYWKGTAHALSSTRLDDGKWHHAAFTKDNSGNIQLYVDGKPDGSGSVQRTFADTNSFIGAWKDGDGHVDGSIDDVRIYNQALTANEIQRIYNATRPSPINTSRTDRLTSGLVGFWSMNGQDVDLSDSGAEVKDTTANDNHGDAKNGAKPAIGKLGQGYGFDGTDDYIEVSDNATISFGSGSFTMSTWWKITNGNTDRVLDKRLSGAGYELVPRNDVVSVYLGDGSDSPHLDIGSTNINDGEWHHVVATVAAPDGAGDRTVTVYVDGSYDGETTFTDVGDVSSGSDLFVGAANGGSGAVVNGSIDNVRLYDRELSADEVEKLYRLGE
jgi:hypothetical protein